MGNDKHQRIVDRLIDRTIRRKLEWKKGENACVFRTDLTNYSLTVAKDEGMLGGTDYMITIIDSNGNIIDTFSEIDLGEDYLVKMSELYQNARRQALGCDGALDEILDQLDGPL